MSAMKLDQHGLVVVDVQKSFDDPVWGRRNNPTCEENIAALVGAWRARRRPVIFVRHDSRSPEGRIKPGTAGHSFKSVLTGEPDLLVAKSVHSAFYGEPDLHRWLQERGVPGIVVCGITTNHCCETTARMGGNLGYDVRFVLDATHTFDQLAPDGTVILADDVARMTATNLHGEFATVVTTKDIIAECAS